MFLSQRKQPSIRAIKLYSVSSPERRVTILRDALVDMILGQCERYFGGMPTQFDIHGPYGIPKGRSIGLQAFRNKLVRRGHADYYALNGEIPGSFGFSCLFDARTRTAHVYTELVFWYLVSLHQVNVELLVASLSRSFPIDYGFVIDLPPDYSVVMESKIKKTMFGAGVSTNKEFHRWRGEINTVLTGKVRGLYPYNFLNDAQVNELLSLGFPQASSLVPGLSILAFPDPIALEDARSRLARSADA